MTEITQENKAIASTHENSACEINATASRRQLLKIGAATAPAVLTLRPGHAWAASFNCTVRIPYIIQDTTSGAIVPILPIDSEPPAAVPTGQVIVAPPRVVSGRFYIATEILAGGLPDAHVRYLSTVSAGQGLTCLQSIGYVP
jgi:hypothetical protein